MRLTLKIAREKMCLPLPAMVFLDAQKAMSFRNAELGLRHPLSLYSTSLRSLVEAFTRVLDDLDALGSFEADKRLGSEPASALRRDTHSLIQAVFEHFEHCKSVVSVFVRELSSNEQAKRTREFSATVQEARAFAATQANYIKHEQGIVRLIQMVGEGVVVPGYYIEGVDQEGMISPHPKVHPGGRTAFSYGRALRHFACSVRFFSGALVSTLGASGGADNSVVGLGPLAPIFERLAGLDCYLFPNEANGMVPSIVAREANLAVEFPSRGRWLHLENYTVNTNPEFDGVMRAFRMPYLGNWQESGA